MGSVDILLINPPFHTRNGGGSFFPLGLGYIISSVIECGYTWDVIDCTKIISSFYVEDLNMLAKKLTDLLQKRSPCVIGIGPCITSQLRALKIISKCCKAAFPTVPVIAGGPLASISGQEWLFYEELGINHIIKGDGELAIPDAIRVAKQTGSVTKSSMVSRPDYSYFNEIPDINTISFPFRNIHGLDKYSIRRSSSHEPQKQAAMITSRGCPYACNYCVSGNLLQKVRKRNVNSIIHEMVDLHTNHGINDVIFYDDCFFGSRVTLTEDVTNFCRALLLESIQVTWQIEMRPDLFVLLDADSIHLLNDCGCRQINLGIEKVSSAGLNFLGKPALLTGLKEKIQLVKSISKIKISGTFILGGGEETQDDIIWLIHESTNMGLDFAHYNPLFIYPGTPLYQQVFDNEREWAHIISHDILPWGEIVFESDRLNCTDLLILVDQAYTEFYKSTSYAKEQMVMDRFNIKQTEELP